MSQTPAASADARPLGELLIIPVALATVTVLVIQAVRASWLTDDAFIAFRYVDNLASGRGLVFNPGERVEGFSSLLFVLVLAPLRAMGIAPAAAARVLGIGGSVVELLALLFLAFRLTKSAGVALAAGALLATDRIVTVWSTGGLETSFHAGLVFVAFGLMVHFRDRPDRGVWPLAVVHLFVTASRPEGVAYLVLYLGAFAYQLRRTDLDFVRNLVRALVITAFLQAIVYGFRYAYFRSLVPNTYRAKVEGVPDLAMFGWGYAEQFAMRVGWTDGAHALVWGSLIAAVVWASRPVESAPRKGKGKKSAPIPDALAVLLITLAYVVMSFFLPIEMGGDYMNDFRFYRPAMGLIYFAVACALGLVAARGTAGKWGSVALGIAFLISHGQRQRKAVPIFADAPPSAPHKEQVGATLDEAKRFTDAMLRFAIPTDSVIADRLGIMGYGHTLRTIDATGLVSPQVLTDFYLREAMSDAGKRERLPGHARWPGVPMMQREHVAIIFPKINRKPPSVPEIGPRAPARYKSYPFLHVTVPLGNGEFLRFLTTFTADELRARSALRGIPLCLRPAFGALECVGGAIP